MPKVKKNPDFVEKTCPTCNETFSVSFYKRNIQKFCSKKCSNNHPDTLSKMRDSQKKTIDDRYDGKHPMQHAHVVQNFKDSMRKKYGVEHALRFSEFLNKSKTTKIERYGNARYNNIEKMKQTCLVRYGVDNARKCDVVNRQIVTTIQDSHYEYLKRFCSEKNIEFLTPRSEYVGYDFKNKYQFRCQKCQHLFESDVYKPYHIFCRVCNPTDHRTLENSIYNFIANIIPPNTVIKQNDRTILNGKELDIYIPFKKIAFEINGLYWHSENGRGVSKHYHIKKYKSCLFNRIRLIHIFENEWVYKRPIVESIIRSSLGLLSVKINARDCKIVEVSDEDKKEFLLANHIQGNDQSKIRYGLKHNEKLVSLMTFGSSRFDKKIQWEIIRYCNALNTSVVGSASKLFSHFVKAHSPTSVMSYSDMRYFSGNVYNSLGFSFVRNTPPNYHYISQDYKSLFSRMMFQKHRLKKLLPNFNPTLTEWENMRNHGWDRIWDCGNTKWIWRPAPAKFNGEPMKDSEQI